MKLLISAILLGNLTITSYRSIIAQTDNSPFITATGEHVCRHGVAVSRDLLKRWGGPLDYGDVLYIDGFGFKVINDTMNARHRRHIDIWVKTYKEEKQIGIQSKKVWLIRTIP